MYSWEIEQLMIMRNYLLNKEEYLNILSTSPQINRVTYHKDIDNFYIGTDDKYEFYFKVKKKEM